MLDYVVLSVPSQRQKRILSQNLDAKISKKTHRYSIKGAENVRHNC